jgi:uncharacterized membrane protein
MLAMLVADKPEEATEVDAVEAEAMEDVDATVVAVNEVRDEDEDEDEDIDENEDEDDDEDGSEIDNEDSDALYV